MRVWFYIKPPEVLRDLPLRNESARCLAGLSCASLCMFILARLNGCSNHDSLKIVTCLVISLWTLPCCVAVTVAVAVAVAATVAVAVAIAIAVAVAVAVAVTFAVAVAVAVTATVAVAVTIAVAVAIAIAVAVAATVAVAVAVAVTFAGAVAVAVRHFHVSQSKVGCVIAQCSQLRDLAFTNSPEVHPL